MKKFNVGDYVMYGSSGICRIDGEEKKCFSGGDEREYYVLSSVYDAKKRSFVPTDSEATGNIRCVLTKAGIDAVIDSSEMCVVNYDHDRKKRAEEYTEIIKSGDGAKILMLYKTLFFKKAELSAASKRLTGQDESALSFAEKAITEEFSFVLGIDKAQVVEYIRQRLSSKCAAEAQ